MTSAKALVSRRSPALLAMALLLSVLAAPGVASAQIDEFTCPATGGTLVIATPGDPVSLNGVYANDGLSVAVLSFIYNPLVLGGRTWVGLNGETHGGLAESWDISADGLTYTFHIRQGVKWHDGEDLTADDVLFTFQTIQDPEGESVQFRGGFLQNGEPIPFEATDDYTVVATLTQPSATFLTDITVPIVPRHVLEGQDLREGPFNREPVGTGPFRLVEWRTGESLTLEAFDDYFWGRPCLDRIVFRIIPDDQARVNALLTGEVDLLAPVPGASVERVQQDGNFNVVTAEEDSLFFIVFNPLNPPLDNALVRQALFVALDRQAIVDTVWQGFGIVHNSHFGAPVPFYQQDKLGGYDYDPERAAAMLDEAGVTDVDGDGWRDFDGKTWEPEFVSFNLGTASRYGEVAQVAIAYWEDVGVKVTLELKDFGVLVDEIYAENKWEKPFDLHNSGVANEFGVQPGAYWVFYTTTEEVGPNFMNYNNPEVNGLFAEAAGVVDDDERMAMYEQIEAILWEDLPSIPLYRRTVPVAISNRFSVDAAVVDVSMGTHFKYPERISMTP